MDDKERLTKHSSSHLYRRKKWKLEHIGNRLIGMICINRKRRFGWTGWKRRWVEAHDNRVLFYKYSKKRRHYKRIKLLFKGKKPSYSLGGLEYNNGLYTFGILENGKKKYLVRTPDKTAVDKLYSHLGILDGNPPVQDVVHG